MKWGRNIAKRVKKTIKMGLWLTFGGLCFENRKKSNTFVYLSLVSPFGWDVGRSNEKAYLMMEQRVFRFDYNHYDSLADLSEADRGLVAEAKAATQGAHAPYSHFQVGAAARLRSGRILKGSNIESEVYPAGLCAERTLLFHHAACYADDPIEVLAIASQPAQRECYPCGQCRQVLVDTERRQKYPFRILMCGEESVTEVSSAEKLLPFTFIL